MTAIGGTRLDPGAGGDSVARERVTHAGTNHEIQIVAAILPGLRGFCRALDTVGDGSGTKSANVNHSGAAEEYYIQPAAGDIMRINELRITLFDSAFSTSLYGNVAGVTNGVTIKHRQDPGSPTDVVDFTDGVPVTTSGGYLRMFRLENNLSGALAISGFSTQTYVIDFKEMLGTSLRLVGDDLDYLSVGLNDDFSGLNEHYFTAHGFYELKA